jgi:MFS family permease
MGKHGWITKFTAIRFFLGGIEIYIIAPTAWYYIRSLGQTKFFLALVFTSYNVGAIIAGPLFGFITDRFGNPRFMFIFCCAMKVVASVMYSVNLSAYFPLFGRLLTGLSGDIAILLGQVAL